MFFTSTTNAAGSLTFLKWYWKIIGVVICLLSLLLVFFCQHFFPPFASTHLAELKAGSSRMLILGLMLLAFSRDKATETDDCDMLAGQRQVMLVRAFAFAILMTCLFPLIDLAFGDVPTVITPESICRNSLLFFLAMYYWQKLKMMKGVEKNMEDSRAALLLEHQLMEKSKVHI